MANIKISEMTEIDELNGQEYVPLIQNSANVKYKISKRDSGWKTATLGSSFKAYNNISSNTPQYRKVGKTVEIRGIVSPNTEISGGATEYTIFTLPEGFRPSKQITKICQGSTKNIWLITINTDGVVEFSRHRDETGYTNATTTAWLLFSETFLID